MLTMKATGIDLSNPKSMMGASRLSAPQVKFFCSQIGTVDAQDLKLARKCSPEYANIVVVRNRLCVGKVGDDVISSDGEDDKCKVPTKPSADNCKPENRAKVTGACGAQLVQDCIKEKRTNCDNIKVSVQTCDHKHLLKSNDGSCYERVNSVCAAQNDDGTYIPSHKHIIRPLIHRCIRYRLYIHLLLPHAHN